MKRVFIAIITAYQKVLSPDQGFIPRFLGLTKKVCIFYPTCSEYTKQAIYRHGILKGIYLGGKRIARCTPWNEPRVDEVPE
jgi:putative membrane protein insertion efficiency factor